MEVWQTVKEGREGVCWICNMSSSETCVSIQSVWYVCPTYMSMYACACVCAHMCNTAANYVSRPFNRYGYRHAAAIL